jgi:hypothetical protein
VLICAADPTGFNGGYGQFNSSMSPPPSAPSPANNANPANIFAQMKSGTFGDDSAPQAPGKSSSPFLFRGSGSCQTSDRYDALRPQQTGWNGNGYQQTGYGYR